MELRFSITSDQLKKLAACLNSERTEKNAHLAARLYKIIATAFMLGIPLSTPLIIYCFFWKTQNPETLIVTITTCIILYLLAWKISIKKRINHKISTSSEKIKKLTHPIETVTAQSLAKLEGSYKATITPKALLLNVPNGTSVTIAWRRIFYFQKDSDFYYLRTSLYLLFRVTYLISKNGDMADTKNQTTLEETFSRLNIHEKSRPAVYTEGNG